jgi:hypothetical protein
MENDKNKKMVDLVAREFTRYENFHSDRFKEAEEIYDNWLGIPKPRAFEWQNAVHVPITFEAEQTITPRILTALFPNDAPVDVRAEGDAPEAQAVKIKAGIQHSFRVSNVQGKANPALGQCTLYGTGYLEGGSWLIKRGWAIDENGERYYAITDSRPDCQYVNFFEMFPHPAKISIDDGLPIIRRRFIDAEQLKSLAENPFFQFQNLKEALDSEPMIRPQDMPKAYQAKKGEDYEVLEYWGPFDINYEKDGKIMTKKAVPHWIIVINRKVLIRGIPNPYNHQLPPYCKFILYPDKKPSWFGIGAGTVGKPAQERVNKIVNQRLDNVDLVINRMGFYDGNDTMMDPKKLQVSKPGLWMKVQDTVRSIKWMDTPDVTRSSYEEERIAKEDFRQSTGATAQLMPSPDDEQHRTALGIQILQGAAGMRFRPILQQIELDLVAALAMFYFSNMKQFMTNDEWVHVSGAGGHDQAILLRPEDIQAKVFFIPTGITETMNKEVQIGQLLKFKEVSQEDPTVNRVELNRRIAELMGFKDLDKLFVEQQPANNQSPLSPEQQQLIQQRLAEGASPDDIKAEIAGPPPMESMQGGM